METTRFEAHYFRKKNDKKNLADMLSDIVDGDNDEEKEDQGARLSFVTAEDLLNKAK
jgi:hypothetical protein